MDRKVLNMRVNKYFKLYLSLFTIVVGILFIWQTGDIYFTGKNSSAQMYTYEIIGAHFNTICIPVYIYLASIILGIVVHFVFPLPKEKLNIKKEFMRMYINYSKNHKVTAVSNLEAINTLKKAKTKRTITQVIYFVLNVACLVMTCCYIFNFSFYSKDGNLIKEMVNIVIHILPWIVISFASSCIYLYYMNYNYRISLGILKSIDTEKVEVNENKYNNKVINFLAKNSVLITRICVGVIAVTFIILGICNEGYQDVLKKAVNICTECIGLG